MRLQNVKTEEYESNTSLKEGDLVRLSQDIENGVDMLYKVVSYLLGNKGNKVMIEPAPVAVTDYNNANTISIVFALKTKRGLDTFASTLKLSSRYEHTKSNHGAHHQAAIRKANHRRL